MKTSNVDVVFYDGFSSKPHHAQIHAIDEQTVLIRYGEQLELERRYSYEDMTLIGALGKIHPVIELKDDQNKINGYFLVNTNKGFHFDILDKNLTKISSGSSS